MATKIAASQSSPNINPDTTPKNSTQQIIPQQPQQASPGSTPKKQQSNNMVGVHYKIGRKIGEGSFGIIYEGKSKLKRRQHPELNSCGNQIRAKKV